MKSRALARSDCPATFEEALGAITQLGRLTELYQHRRQQLAQSVGLTEREWAVLEEVSTEHFMPSLFARKSESTPAAVSKIIRQLLDKALISVSVSREDARHRDYVLTAKGRRILLRLRKLREDAITTIWLEFGSPELAQFTDFASRLVARLEAYAARAIQEE